MLKLFSTKQKMYLILSLFIENLYHWACVDGSQSALYICTLHFFLTLLCKTAQAVRVHGDLEWTALLKPQILNWIEVLSLTQPFHKFVVFMPFVCSFGCLLGVLLKNKSPPKLQFSCRLHQHILLDFPIFCWVYFRRLPGLAAKKHPHSMMMLMMKSQFRSQQIMEPSSSWLKSLTHAIWQTEAESQDFTTILWTF